jgi:hypothetical protein
VREKIQPRQIQAICDAFLWLSVLYSPFREATPERPEAAGAGDG